MLTTLALINTIIFMVLSGIHFYWAMGGRWALATSLPSNPSTQDFLFKPSVMATLVVALGLFLFGLVTLQNAFNFPLGIEPRYFRWGDLVISFIFLMRAVGDFKFVGFFKRIRETPFGRNDSKFYSPLCLIIAIIGFMIFQMTLSRI